MYSNLDHGNTDWLRASRIVSADGFLLGCNEVDFSTMVFDITPSSYGTGLSFADGDALADYLDGVGFGNYEWLEEYCMLVGDDNASFGTNNPLRIDFVTAVNYNWN